ncbi:unnamed protein product [Darwinula stevensoni]|uniref:Uncharacterized protein n=1 Tax=Darwinula stevensoni TaxID=69355 RepID=A0A7R9FUJ3_9CRUS|nr:unnamed protein product [Darwinula stevensoni]CAG0907629.1 unnamed protein product [Darwinula stevensoni]
MLFGLGCEAATLGSDVGASLARFHGDAGGRGRLRIARGSPEDRPRIVGDAAHSRGDCAEAELQAEERNTILFSAMKNEAVRIPDQYKSLQRKLKNNWKVYR